MKWIYPLLVCVSISLYLISFSSRSLFAVDQPIPHEISARRFAVFSCSIHSTVRVYTFYAPIIAAAWKRLGYESIVYFVGDFTHQNVSAERLNSTRTLLKRLGAQIVDVQCPESYSVKVSQMIRVFSGFLPQSLVRENDSILTTDSDLMPLQAKHYELAANADGFIYNARCCGSFQRRERVYRMYPMGHISLPKRIWRQIILESVQHDELIAKNASNAEATTLSFELVQLYGRHEFPSLFDGQMVKGDPSWYMDQVLSSMLISDYQRKHPNVRIDERKAGRRLDRSAGIAYWDRANFDQFADAHLLHDEVLQETNWKIFRKFLRAFFNETLTNAFDDYYLQNRFS